MPAFRNLIHSSFHRSIAESLGYCTPRVTQSQLVAKSAGVGGEIVPHQDGRVSFTNPPSGLTFWYALEDTTVENGCLSVATRSHLTEPVRERMVKGEKGVPKFEALETPLWAREKSRMAYTFSIVDGDLESPDDNYMKPIGRNFDHL